MSWATILFSYLHCLHYMEMVLVTFSCLFSLMPQESSMLLNSMESLISSTKESGAFTKLRSHVPHEELQMYGTTGETIISSVYVKDNLIASVMHTQDQPWVMLWNHLLNELSWCPIVHQRFPVSKRSTFVSLSPFWNLRIPFQQLIFRKVSRCLSVLTITFHSSQILKINH